MLKLAGSDQNPPLQRQRRKWGYFKKSTGSADDAAVWTTKLADNAVVWIVQNLRVKWLLDIFANGQFAWEHSGYARNRCVSIFGKMCPNGKMDIHRY